MTLRNLDMTTQLKEGLRELAHQERTSMASYVAGIVQDVAEGKVQIDAGDGYFDTTIKFPAPEGYEDALSRARAAGVPLAEVVRREIARRAA